MASKATEKRLPVRGGAPGELERIDVRRWERLARIAQALLASTRSMVSAIMSATGGITGQISDLLSRAAEAAIRAQKECITPDLLQHVIGARA